MITGEGIYCFQDNITTDGIFPSSHTYNENLSNIELAELSMKNYDDNFFKLSKKGDILLSGYNFGIGSSREQAVTCLKAKGIKLVIGPVFHDNLIYLDEVSDTTFLSLTISLSC